MALTVTTPASGSGGARVLSTAPSSAAPTFHPLCRVLLIPSSAARTPRVITFAKKQRQEFSSITGKFDSKNRRRSSSPTTTEEEDDDAEPVPTLETVGPESSKMVSRSSAGVAADDGYFLPELPGDKPDFWEGEQWEALGFFVQYLWAFGIFFAAIACGIAVATYNEGATDFKETPVYKEAIGSRELLDEQPDAGSDVFESNPTEVAPSLN
ncbi:hypothetical protein MLD38_026214 [Melastoma candidum]|uniref:Uncharacterized protein n=1 Tax=Melastoma candidum TaxID=119954 RepID=A0ACB9NYW1_9MYRT|nr:hypothetical protein MLD38_026214 [Melastoma candidum]